MWVKVIVRIIVMIAMRLMLIMIVLISMVVMIFMTAVVNHCVDKNNVNISCTGNNDDQNDNHAKVIGAYVCRTLFHAL